MTPAEIEVILHTVFGECDAAGYPLTAEQKEIIFRTLVNRLSALSPGLPTTVPEEGDRASPPSIDADEEPNPLDALTPEQRQALLQFIQDQERQSRPWKAQLLNDWLNEQDSGSIQFIRELYGIPWLEQITPNHIARYQEELSLRLSVGDRIEVSNGLWEWVQDEGPCSREWFPCTVVQLTDVAEPSALVAGYDRQTNCIIRFDNGMEYEVQGIYEWNRYNWRWLKG